MAILALNRVLLFSSILAVSLAAGNLDVEAFPDGSFSVLVGGVQWFRSGPVGARDLGQWWSQDTGSLELIEQDQSTGSDNVGSFSSYGYTWRAVGGASSLSFRTVVSLYDEFPAALFSVVFLTKATETNIGTAVNSVLSTFPSFMIEEGPVERGYVTWSGNSEF